MSTTAQKHARHAARLLKHADEMAEDRDHLQASEKIWGSVAHTLKQIAEKRDWPHESNSDLTKVVGYLTAATGDNAIKEQYQRARSFHTNFYEDEYPLEDIKEGVLMAQSLVARLNAAARKVDAGARPQNGADNPTDYNLRQDTSDINAATASLRRQGLTNIEAAEAAQVLRRVRSHRVLFRDVSFRVGDQQKRVTVGKDGMPRVGKPKVPQRNPQHDAEEVGTPGARVKRRR